MTGADRAEIVAFIANDPGMAKRLLDVHREDGTGHCRVCVNGGVRHVWPCPLHGLAVLALAQPGRG
jgi:hypothetical protein